MVSVALLSGMAACPFQGQTPVPVGNCGPMPVNSCSKAPTCKKSTVYGGTWIPGAPYPKGTKCTTNNVPTGPAGSCNGMGGCVAAASGPSGIMTPKYLILTLIYAPPGSSSSVSYTNGSATGTTNGGNQSQGGSFTAGVTGNFTLTDTVSGSTTKASTLQVTKTITQGLASSSTEDVLDHGNDTFYILVHPPFNYQQPVPGGPIAVSPASGIAQLTPLVLSVDELTGKKPIPSNKQSQLQDLTAQDLAEIASVDPLVNSSAALGSSRFTKVDEVQISGPDYAGDTINNPTYAESDNATSCKTETNAWQNTTTVGFSAGADFFGQGEKATFSASITEGGSSTSGNCAGTITTASFTPRSSTIGFLVPVDVYEDGAFHTIAFSERPELNPGAAAQVRGILRGITGRPLANAVVTVTFSDGSVRHVATTANGGFVIARPPAGAVTIQSGSATVKTTLAAGQKSIPALTFTELRRTEPIIK